MIKKIIGSITAILAVMVVAISCNQEPSTIGESIQPIQDQVSGSQYNLQFTSKTIPVPQVYTNTTLGLLGEIYDNSFGDFKGEFIAQVRTAPGFSFEHEPVNGQIDSVKVNINYINYIGDSYQPIKIAVFRIDKPLHETDFSQPNLDNYRKEGTLVGESNIILSSDTKRSLFDSESARYISIPIDKSIGQKIYELSKKHPEYFDTQESFSKNVLGGLLVTSTTGTGFVIQTTGLSVNIYYSYPVTDSKTSKTTNEVGVATFINTTQTLHINGLSNSDNSNLLQPNSDYTFVSSPAGVSTLLTLPKEQLNELIKGQGKVTIGRNWDVSYANITLKVNRPETVILNPPVNVMLIPKDSVANFFVNGESLSGYNARGYLSTEYSVVRHTYSFPNIAGVISNFINKNKHFDATQNSWVVDKDLELEVIPVLVSQQKDQYTQSSSTTINQYLFPSMVRLSKEQTNLQMNVIVSRFNN